MKKIIETFRSIGDFELRNITQDKPSCFNGFVTVKKYRVTIEEIEEPKEVIAGRLQKLWDECANWHHHVPLKNAAKKIGYELKNDAGAKRP